ncbi:uncharacterized protein LOC135501239 isoform X2 [Lineus longissimus]|uniref:uncharacterized protein LOC135501239 isoform X2 n=1 Tax=Lineus longissimus TaxID=88925 RepID=UPI002B4D5521
MRKDSHINIMRQGIFVVFLVCAFHGVTGDTAADLQAIIDEFWDWRLLESPEFGSKYGIYAHENMVEEYSFAAFDRRKQKADELYTRLTNLADVKLRGQDKMSFAVLKSLLENYRMGYEFRYYGPMNPANSMETPISEWKKYISWMRTDSAKDYENIISRMEKIPAQMNQLIVFLQKAIDMGTTDHEKSMSGIQKSFDDLAGSQPNETFFYAPFTKMPAAVNASAQTALKQKAETLIKDNVLTSFKKLGDFLVNTYMKNLRPNMAAISMPNGKKYYEACLKWHLSMDMSPEEIHKKGLEEVESIEAKMIKIMRDNNFDGSVKEYIAKLNADPANHYTTEEGMLNGFRDIIENKIRSKLGLVLPIDSVPKLKLEVRKSENTGGATGRYSEPPVDGSRPGIFWANVYEPETRAKYNMMALALHEAEPGHHTQASYNYGNNLPLFRRLIEYRKYYAVPYNWPFFTAYIEGWALYAESLGEEMGVYEGNDFFGKYASEIHRAARLVVDTGLHYYNWTYEQATGYLSNYTALPPHQIENELNRYIGWPGQAVSYKIGEIKIRELRDMAKQKLKERFSLLSFNNETLFTGPVPMDTLDAQIKRWIDRVILTAGAPRLSFSFFTPMVVMLLGLFLRN